MRHEKIFLPVIFTLAFGRYFHDNFKIAIQTLLSRQDQGARAPM
jgi:hypothetical protein